MKTVGPATRGERTTNLVADTLRLDWPDLAIWFSFLFVGFAGELTSCKLKPVPHFGIYVWPELYCLAVMFAGVRLGPWSGLVCAGLASILSMVASRICAENDTRWSLMISLLAVGLVAGWLAKRNMSARSGADTVGRDPPEWNEGRSISELGRLMPEVVNQFRTPIASIQGAGFVLEDPELSQEKRQEFVGILRKECQHLQLLVELLDFTHSRCSAEAEADIHRLFGEVVAESTFSPDSRVVLTNRAPSDLPPLRCEPELIKRALIILVVEVRRALSGRGEVVLSARELEGEMLLRVDANSEDTQSIHATLARAFAQSDLAIVRNVVDRHGGSLRFEPSSPTGASICISLPFKRRRAHEYRENTSRRRR